MSSELVILTEERSMALALESLLPKLGIDLHGQCKIIPHNGISALKKSLPNKLKAWRNPAVKFIILVDQDSSDCIERKKEFVKLCSDAKKEDQCVVRIVCKELESWFLGDFEALTKSGLLKQSKKKTESRKSKYREPDKLDSPSQEISKLVPNYQKIDGAKTIAPHLALEHNRSKSFNVFIQTMNQFRTQR